MSRIVVTVALAAAIVLSALGGVSLAQDDGATGQSPAAPLGQRSLSPSVDTGGDVEGQNDAGVALGQQAAGGSGSGAGDGTGAAADSGAGAADPDVVAAADDGGLPFTGYVAIPILLIGALALAAGALLRRRSTPSRQA